jgi:MFS family permease
VTSLLVFVAALGPILTVVALRRVLAEGHGLDAFGMHVFVALGMLGAALGAPLLGRMADRSGRLRALAATLALLDAATAVATSLPSSPTALLFVLRPLHGAASMGLLALLFASVRAAPAGMIVRAGVPMVTALALGPALGGILAKSSARAPFLAAAFLSGLVALAILARKPAPLDAAPRRRDLRVISLIRPLAAPLALTAAHRFAIGGLVVAFATRARIVHGLADSKIGACFSVLLVVFAIAICPVARIEEPRLRAWTMGFGALLFGASIAMLSVAPRWGLVVALALAGVGSAMLYAPTLALAQRESITGERATAMGLVQAAGALGMILGPLVGAALERAMHAYASETRAAAFMTLAGVIVSTMGLGLLPSLLSLGSLASTTQVREKPAVSQ